MGRKNLATALVYRQTESELILRQGSGHVNDKRTTSIPKEKNLALPGLDRARTYQTWKAVKSSAIPVSVLGFSSIPPCGSTVLEVWPLRCQAINVFESWFSGRSKVRRSSPGKERRKWDRLHLAIPVFVRSKDGNGKDCLEFATAMNVSAGGALVVSRRALPPAAAISLEIPSAPFGPVTGFHRSARSMRARVVWIAHLNSYSLLGLRFLKPLPGDATSARRSARRKAPSGV